MWRYVQIRPASGGFGEYDTTICIEESFETEDDIVADLLAGGEELYELGVDDLPDGCEDIRGSVHDEPDRIFANFCGGAWWYTGIEKVTEEV